VLVLAAYGRSRIRQLIVGSTTTTLLWLSEVPVLNLRQGLRARLFRLGVLQHVARNWFKK